jgi:O-antigen/teichoic acid export membrane protein
VWATPWTALLQGVGYVGWDAILVSLMNCLTLLCQIVAVTLGCGLMTLACLAAGGALAQRFLLFGFARANRPELFDIDGRWNSAVLRSMISPSVRAWLTALGIVLVHNTDQLFIGRLKGVEQVPAYRAAYLVALNLHMLAAAFATASAVFISHLWQANQRDEVKRTVMRNLRLGLCIMACGAAGVLVAGRSLFDLWLGPGNYVGPALLAIFLVTFFLEQQSYILSTSSRATEDEAFAISAVLGGALKLVLSYLLIVPFGLMGLAVGTLGAQLATNHWFMVYRGLTRLEIPAQDLFVRILLPVLVVFLSAFGASEMVVRLQHDPSDGWRLACAAVVSLSVLVIAIWILILEPSHRARVRTAVRRMSPIRAGAPHQ